MAELELNKIVGMIMENPELVEKIKAMGNAAIEKEGDSFAEAPNEERPPVSIPKGSKRSELLRSIEGFLSAERKKSLETMLTLADVLDSVRRKEN